MGRAGDQPARLLLRSGWPRRRPETQGWALQGQFYTTRAGGLVSERSQVGNDKRPAGRTRDPSAQVGLSVSIWRHPCGVLQGPGLGVVSTFGVLGPLHRGYTGHCPQGPQHSLLVSSRVPSPSGSNWPPQLPCSFRTVFCRARHGFPDRGDSRPGAGSRQDEQVDKQAGTTHLLQEPRC